MTSRIFASGQESKRSTRIATRAILGTATVALLAGAAAAPAFAAPGDFDTASVVANVNVNSTITLNLDVGSFVLSGPPSSTATTTGAVTGVVTTNNVTGYSVDVVAAAATLVPSVQGNADTIPIANLQVADSDGVYTSLSTDPLAAVTTTTKDTRTALPSQNSPGGDIISDDYKVAIPDVNSDTYSVTLNYTATALA